MALCAPSVWGSPSETLSLPDLLTWIETALLMSLADPASLTFGNICKYRLAFLTEPSRVGIESWESGSPRDLGA